MVGTTVTPITTATTTITITTVTTVVVGATDSSSSASSSSSSMLPIIIGAAAGGTVLIIVVVVLLLRRKRTKQQSTRLVLNSLNGENGTPGTLAKTQPAAAWMTTAFTGPGGGGGGGGGEAEYQYVSNSSFAVPVIDPAMNTHFYSSIDNYGAGPRNNATSTSTLIHGHNAPWDPSIYRVGPRNPGNPQISPQIALRDTYDKQMPSASASVYPHAQIALRDTYQGNPASPQYENAQQPAVSLSRDSTWGGMTDSSS